MAEITKYEFSHREVVEALIKQQGLHSGVWSLYAEFGLAATNAGPSAEELNPAVIIPLLKLGLTKAKEPNNLSVDAAVVNPAHEKSSVTGKKRSKVP